MRRARSSPVKTSTSPPEQARREVTDARADLFASGIVLAELLLDENIFEAEDSVGTRRNILEMPIPDFTKLRSGIDDKLNGILHKVLQRDRDARYQMGQEMLTALEMYLYSDSYGPTTEKLAGYLSELFADGPAYLQADEFVDDADAYTSEHQTG